MDQKEKALNRLKENPPDKLAGMTVERVNDIDGRKFFFTNNEWLLVRPSGTEPLIRMYGEAKSEDNLAAILQAGQKLVTAD